MTYKSLIALWLRQQKQLTMPELVFSKPIDTAVLSGKKITLKPAGVPAKTVNLPNKASAVSAPAQKKVTIEKPVVTPQQPKPVIAESAGSGGFSLASRLSGLKPLEQLVPVSSRTPRQKPDAVTSHPQQKPELSEPDYTTYDEKRAALRTLFYAGCKNCVLSNTRKTFVFGAGNADAAVMVIGEAPGADEDEQGLPFVGAAGQLLTSMLSAINLDRNKNVFITNVLKCRPPENRNPESTEIITCTPILQKQIAIIRPKAILLLGRIAAHSVLGLADSIAKLRSKVHMYKDIPSMVIYHPAALLRNPEYKRPAWEDLKQFQVLLTDLGVYNVSK